MHLRLRNRRYKKYILRAAVIGRRCDSRCRLVGRAPRVSPGYNTSGNCYLLCDTYITPGLPSGCRARRMQIERCSEGQVEMEMLAMKWEAIGSSGLGELTKPRSTGRPINPHEVRHKPVEGPDFDKMRDLVHRPAAPPEERPDA